MTGAGTVKICSLRRPEQAEFVISAGADYFGLIFVESAWRKVDPVMGQRIASEVKSIGGSEAPRAVGVFLGSTVDEINRIADQTSLDCVQLNAADVPGDPTDIERPIIAVLRPAAGDRVEIVIQQIGELESRGTIIEAILIDAFSPTGHGGLGELVDWTLAAQIAGSHPVMLAGGLTPENVGEAIRTVGPIGVDVASGVETDREKDREKIVAFVHNARAAFAERSIREMDLSPLG